MDEENVRTNIQLKQKQHLYYAQILPSVGTYNVLEMTVSTLYNTYFAVTEKRDKHRYLFNYTDINKTIFLDRTKCLKKVKDAESHGKKVSNETYYEED